MKNTGPLEHLLKPFRGGGKENQDPNRTITEHTYEVKWHLSSTHIQSDGNNHTR